MKENEQIFQLYIQHLSGELTPEEATYIETKLREDEDFRRVWASFSEGERARRTETFAKELSADGALAELKSRKRGRGGVRRMWYAAAAVVTGIAVTGAILLWQQRPATQTTAQLPELPASAVNLVLANGQTITLNGDSAQTISLQQATLHNNNGTLAYQSTDTSSSTLRVPAGGTYKMMLADGTTVWLNASSSLRFPFSFNGPTRDVYVDGEAFFKVAQNAERPFIVHTPQTEVRVLGTSFNINTYQPGAERTALVEGSVQLQSRDGKQLTLKPGLQADYSSNGFRTGAFDEEEVTAWMSGVYYFHKMPVADIAVIASRFYGIRFRAEGERFASVAITGLMDRARLDEFLNDLETTAGADIRVENQTVFLK
ncbi:FecR family protein [Chitinophaga sp. GCM10012297]|uniref:FecR domain-containing protein n=1 Tax=Chitinophaga chungangae TaxID=2821488 RepID=A0ABS3Y8Z7_9BACT|nr:FecR domain-containing protein [Chitinophaga chungangae]MBO9150803.1 FecR domain-containing protein [Chitinophaga chungangae]